MASDSAAPPQLEPASLEVKRYQRQKITIGIVNGILTLAWIGLLGFVLGPVLAEFYPAYSNERFLRLVASALVLGITLETLTLPLDFYSGYILEHRYQLSNQTLGGWLWKRL